MSTLNRLRTGSCRGFQRNSAKSRGASGTTLLDVARIRQDFPILERKVNGRPLVYLDNAATTQKPRQVIDALVDFYEQNNANVHRGVHTLSIESTDMYELARTKVQRFINAPCPESVIWTRNTSESINLVAHTWGRENLEPGDNIVTTTMEHHSNIRALATVNSTDRRGTPLHPGW